MQKTLLVVKTILLYLVITLLFVIPIYVYYHDSQLSAHASTATPIIIPKDTPTATTNTTSTKETLITGNPIKISIPSVNINLNVINGTYDPKTQGWTLTSNNAQFATVTIKPNNETGNTLIYGHNTVEIFYPTAYLKIGDAAYVETDNQHIFEYEYTGSSIVNPNNTTIFSYEGSPRLTLLTCNGWFSNYRRLMYFKFVRAY